MAKIDIHIDTETSETHNQGKALPQLTVSNKAGLLSTISISDDQRQAFLYGFGSNTHAKRDDLGYFPDDIRQGKKKLKNDDRCNVLAVTGGRVAFDAILNETDNPSFVYLVGETPDLANLGNCVGGISLESWRANGDRITYLTTKLSCNRNQVGLYYNHNSAFSNHEVQNWDAINPPVMGVSSARRFSGGLAGTPPTNTSAQFAVDFAPGGTFFQGLRAIIISADPFFQANKDPLIQAANNWLTGDTTRYVCYPLQDYQNQKGNYQPTPNKSTLYGPDLTAAYNVLGFLTKSAIESNSAGFFTASNLIKNVV